MGQPPVYILRAPTPGMSQYPQQTIEPRTREKKIIQIKDPNQSNKQLTQEILKQKLVGSLTSTVAGTPNVTPNLSAQSSNSSTSPLTSQQQAEENLRAQFATNLANKKITNVRVEIFTAQEVPKRESTKISAPVASGMEKVNGHDGERKASPASKTDSQVTGLYLTIYLSCNVAVIASFML